MAFEKSTKKLQTMTALEEMRKSMQKLGPIPNDMRIYDYAVHFFNIIVMFQDQYSVSDLAGKQPTEEIKRLGVHISNAGRCSDGWVRAKKGQPVTLDNLYLGNVAGLWTAPAAKFKAESDDKYVQNNIQAQLRGFISGHREPMIDLINKVLKNTKSPNENIFFRLFGKKGNVK